MTAAQRVRPPSRDPLRRARHASARAHPGDPQAARRDRRAADRAARDRALRRPGLSPLPAGHRLPGRADRALRRRADSWPEGVEVRCVDTGLDTPTGGRIKLLEERWAEEPRSARPTPTDVADIDLARLLDFHAGARRARHDDRRAAASCSSASPSSTATTDACSASARSLAPSTGSTAASSASAPARLRLPGARQRARARALAAPRRGRGAARLPPRGLLGVHGHL